MQEVRWVCRTGTHMDGRCMDFLGKRGCMRVLICDQESEMLERIAREFEVDVATSKATCIDLMRANPFDVLVASERLVDGSGLELLSNVATRWPDTLRVLAIEPERRRMLGGKLAPFRLHATIRYPIDEDELERRLIELDQLLGQDVGEDAPDPEPQPVRVPASPARAAAPRVTAVVPPRVAASPAIPRGVAPPTVPRASGASFAQASAGPAAAYAPAAAVRSPGSAAPAARPVRPPPPPTAALKSGASAVRPSLTGNSLGRTPVLPRAAAVEPAPVKRKLGNYTPLGAPEEADLRIVAREFDASLAPIAARAIRAREEANRARKPADKVRSVADRVSRTLKRLLRR